MKFDHPKAGCPILQLLGSVSNRWTVLVAGALRDGPLRFNELRRSVGGISHKMLAQTLKALERDGLVSRTVLPTTPITVEYAMTPLGRALIKTLDSLKVWSSANIAAVRAARTAYDARANVRPRAK